MVVAGPKVPATSKVDSSSSGGGCMKGMEPIDSIRARKVPFAVVARAGALMCQLRGLWSVRPRCWVHW
jgi:hypothetical protein